MQDAPWITRPIIILISTRVQFKQRELHLSMSANITFRVKRNDAPLMIAFAAVASAGVFCCVRSCPCKICCAFATIRSFRNRSRYRKTLSTCLACERMGPLRFQSQSRSAPSRLGNRRLTRPCRHRETTRFRIRASGLRLRWVPWRVWPDALLWCHDTRGSQLEMGLRSVVSGAQAAT
jgi:hypothetical protein